MRRDQRGGRDIAKRNDRQAERQQHPAGYAHGQGGRDPGTEEQRQRKGQHPEPGYRCSQAESILQV